MYHHNIVTNEINVDGKQGSEKIKLFNLMDNNMPFYFKYFL